MKTLSTYVRPAVTLVWTAIIAYCLLMGIQTPEWVRTLYTGIVAYYFAERATLKRPGGEE